jgi:hypothetical protein
LARRGHDCAHATNANQLSNRLFVAKVESDIPHKCPHKAQNPSTSQPRTSIRRPARANRTRHVQDPAGRFRRVLAHEQNARSISGTADLTPRRRDGESFPSDAELLDNVPTVSRRAVADHISSFFPSTPRGHYEDRRDLINWFEDTFGQGWYERDWQGAQRDLVGNHWNIEEPTRDRYARLVRDCSLTYAKHTANTPRLASFRPRH